MPNGSRALAVALAAVASGPFAAAASACETTCPDDAGVVVAHGKSPRGVPWRITATDDAGLIIGFEVRSPGGRGSGYFAGLPASPFVLTADEGSEVDAFHESDISGVTSASVATLRVRMRGGSVLRITPRPAKKAAQAKLPALAGLRFFDVFYSRRLEPTRITALDADGRTLGVARSDQGLFFVE